MPLLARLALRNLWRNRRRTVLTFSALAAGIAYLIIVDSLASGLAGVGVRNVVDYESGDVKVHAPGYFAERQELPLDRTLPAQAATRALKGVDGVTAIAPRVVAGARMTVGWEEFPVIAVAIDPHSDGEVFDLASHVVDGRMPRPGALEATVGAGLGELFGVQVGNYITLITRTSDEALQALDLSVVGLLRVPHPAVNQNHVYLPLDVADAGLAMGGQVTELVLKLDEGRSVKTAAQAAQAALDTAGIQGEAWTWREVAADFLALAEAGTSFDFLLVFFILVIALVGVTNTVLLGALERKREIGTLKAMGMREGEIVRLFLLEATGIGLLAVISGSLLGAAANLFLVEVGLDLTAFFGDLNFGYPVSGVVYGQWNGPIFLWAGVAGIVTCWIAAFIPARRAARRDAAETVRA